MNTKKYIAEFFGTMVLVIIGCGSAVGINTLIGSIGVSVPLALSTLTIAFAFGLAVMVMAYTIGDISGCHINPAVSIGMWASKRMSGSEFIKYCIAQFLGGMVGAAFLVVCFDGNQALGANGFGELSALGTVWYRAFLIEAVLTFIFVLAVLVISNKKELSSVSGLLIGLSLTLVHIMGIPFTGTSVNPARSFGPALFTGGTPFHQVWLFILAPLVGGIVAGMVYKFFIQEKKKK